MRRGAARLALIAIGGLGAPAPASATLFCNVLKSPDGFVALRAGPSPTARVVARMRSGDEVQILEGRRGRWEEVYHWRGNDRLNETKRADKRRGWVNSRYIDDTCG